MPRGLRVGAAAWLGVQDPQGCGEPRCFWRPSSGRGSSCRHRKRLGRTCFCLLHTLGPGVRTGPQPPPSRERVGGRKLEGSPAVGSVGHLLLPPLSTFWAVCTAASTSATLRTHGHADRPCGKGRCGRAPTAHSVTHKNTCARDTYTHGRDLGFSVDAVCPGKRPTCVSRRVWESWSFWLIFHFQEKPESPSSDQSPSPRGDCRRVPPTDWGFG